MEVGSIDHLHPNYYKKDGRRECWDEFVDMFGPRETVHWCLITCYKYMYRAGSKSGNTKMDDLSKAINYFNKASDLMHNFHVSDVETTTMFNKTQRSMTKVFNTIDG